MAKRKHDLRRRLVTPEGIHLGVVLGEAGQRAAAFMLDATLMIAGFVVLTLIAVFGAIGVGEAALQPIAIGWLIAFFVIRNLYFIIMEMRPRAATLGKRWTGLRVVARDGGRLTGDAVIARNLMREIEVFLPLSFLAAGGAGGQVDSITAVFGLAWAGLFLFFPLFNADRMRVGDLLAGTWVIQSSPKTLIDDLAAAPAQTSFVFTAQQLDAYGVLELDTLESVIRRSDADSRLAVAQAIIDRIGWPTAVGDVDGFLTAYYGQLRGRLEKGLLLGRRRASKHDTDQAQAA